MINSVTLVGRTTRDIELKYNTNSTAYAQFTIAVNRPFKNEKGEQQADFINCVAWSKQAENASKYVGKGNQIGVEGRIQTSSWDDNGIRRYSTDIVVNKIIFLEPKKNTAPEPEQPTYMNNDQSQTDQSVIDNYKPPFKTAMPMSDQSHVQNNICNDDLPF